ncbi:acyl carrier protein [Nocardia sp. CNY236]|uniref:acyl carrier protein n=1 Tax=Nocardia sp. CNY236 TaxID=1169152 RepID=UPI00041AED48|nr:acyl carrier protein [Nocardia sp. CNY236]
MSVEEFELADLRRVIRAAAGEVEGLDGDIIDTPFEELGYESLALLETAGRIEREYGVKLEDSVLIDASTPRALLEVVNQQLATEPSL